MKRSPITTHVLDTARGAPATGLRVRLSRGGRELAHGTTDADGRVAALLPAGAEVEAGVYELTFETGVYLKATHTAGFFPEIRIVFEVAAGAHYHVPLLLSPYGYSTYRGS